MSSRLCACVGGLLGSLLVSAPGPLAAQSFAPDGGEYLIGGRRPGDQVGAALAFGSNGGFLLWRDNAIDSRGPGIAAQRLEPNLSPSVFAPFRVNQTELGAQARPQIALLADGTAAVVWQGGRPGRPDIYLRLIKPDGTFASPNDLQVNTYTRGPQSDPAIAALSDGRLVVVWTSLGEDGSGTGVFGRLFNSQGEAVGDPFQVNQTTALNQHHPEVAALAQGGFAVVWLSDSVLGEGLSTAIRSPEVHVYARVFGSDGQASGAETRLDNALHLCANPAVVALPSGGFLAAWSQRDAHRTNGWDVAARKVGAEGALQAEPFIVNRFRYGDQFAPRMAASGATQLIVWTSLGQDGSWEGVFGRWLNDGDPVSEEVQVNTTTVSRQLHPTVASDGEGRFLVVWSTLMLHSGFDLMAQRYSAGSPLPTPEPPVVAALSSSRLMVAWPELLGYDVQGYEVVMDDAAPVSTTENHWVATGLGPATTHQFRIAYVFSDGSRSALSAPAQGTTWGEDLNGDGLPDDWQAQYWGYKEEFWDPAQADSDGDGLSNFREFLAGTDPTDPDSVLKVTLSWDRQGRRLRWTTQPGYIYQVQMSEDLEHWSNVGRPRFAAGTDDALPLGSGHRKAFYRIIRVR